MADAPERLELAGGGFTSLRYAASLAGKVEYKSGFNLIRGEASVNPAGGALLNSDTGTYFYGGLRLVFQLSGPWNFENFVGIGGYWRGTGPDLYQTLEFSLAGTITRQLGDGYRAGFEMFHISNAGLQSNDPGSNSYFIVIQKEF
jgi:hypothetical protein